MKLIKSFYSSGKFEQRARDLFAQGSGLASSEVFSVCYDGQGRLWAGTQGGAAVFDGERFRPAKFDNNSAAVCVNRLFLDAAGVLWAACGAAVYYLNGSKFSLSCELDAKIVDMSQNGGKVYALTEASVWEHSGKWVKLGPVPGNPRAFAVNDENFYVATDKALFALSGKRKHWKSMFPAYTSLPHTLINSLCFDSLGYLWAATSSGLCVYDNKSCWLTPENTDTLPAEEIFSVAVDSEGRRCYASDCGVICEDAGSLKYLGFSRWVPDSKVNSIAVSEDCKTIWAATSKGISRISVEMMSLAEKAEHYQKTVEEYHVRDGYVTIREGIVGEDLSTGAVEISDNDGLWTGKYVASQAFRYAVTGDKDALMNARRSVNAMLYLMSVTDIPGFTARAIRREGERGFADGDPEWHISKDGSCEWKCETSSDEMTGHFYALSIYYDLCADESEKKQISDALCAIVDHIEQNDFKLVDYDGKPTTWANWNPASLNDDDRWVWERGINSLELLAFIKTAFHVSGKKHYEELYLKMIKDYHYALNAAQHKVKDGHTCHIDDNLGFLASTTILRLEDNPDIRRLVLMGMEHHFAYERIERAPLWNFVYAAFTGRDDCLGDAVQSLRETPLSLIKYKTVNSNRRGLVYDDEQEFWGEPPQLKTPLPVDERPLQKYDSNPFMFDGGNSARAEDGTMFLLPYWFARYYGLIDESF